MKNADYKRKKHNEKKQNHLQVAISLVACGIINGISYFKWKKRM